MGRPDVHGKGSQGWQMVCGTNMGCVIQKCNAKRQCKTQLQCGCCNNVKQCHGQVVPKCNTRVPGGAGAKLPAPPTPPHPLLFSNVENPWALKHKVNAFNVAQSQSMLEEACWGKHVGRQAWCTLVCSWDQSHMPLHYMLHYNVWQLHSTQAGTAAQFHDTAQLPGAGRWC